MDYLLYTGCTVPLRAVGYEIAAIKVAKELGVNLLPMEEFTCCGYPITFLDNDSSMALAVLNICLAEEKGLNIATLCNSCTGNLTKANYRMKTEEKFRNRINELLSPTGHQWKGTIEIKHFARILYEDVGEEKMKARVTKSLAGSNIAPMYGCHYLKPSKIYDGFDHPDHPESMETLIRSTGAKPVQYVEKTLCCGGPILALGEEMPMNMSQRILDGMKREKADVAVVVCPFCNVMMGEYQSTIGDKAGTEYGIPTFYMPQIIGLAFGFTPKELGLKKKQVKKAFGDILQEDE